MSKIKQLLIVLSITLILSTALHAQLADTPWPMYHRNVQHTAQCPFKGPENPELKWTFKAEPGITGSPVIGQNGTIYIGSWDGYLYALNNDGSSKWHFFTQDKITSTPAIGSNGTIYIESRDGYLYAINPDGILKWKYYFGTDYNNVFPSTTIGDDGTIYVTSDTLYAINPDGTLKWTFRDLYDDYPGVQSSAVISPNGAIHISRNKHLYAIDPYGNFIWRFNMGYYTFNSLAVGPDGSVYVGSDSSELMAVNSDGSEKWRFKALSNFVLSPTIGSDGTIFVASEDNYFYAINPDGSLKWKYKTDRLIRSSSVIDADGVIYFNSWDKYLYALYPDSTLKWKFKTAIGIVSAPAMDSDGTLYFGTYDGIFYALGDSRKVFFDLYTEPERPRFVEGDNLELKLDVKTYAEDVRVDVYVALLTPSSELLFGFDWSNIPIAAASNVHIPAYISLNGASLMQLTIPNDSLPIGSLGEYTFAIAAFDSSSKELLSNLETAKFTVLGQ